jgi:hypothetical protein
MGVDRQYMKNFKEVKTKIEVLERNAVLGENMPNYECQQYKSAVQSRVT